MTREERWLRSEMAPLERITDAECEAMTTRQLAHFKRRLETLRSILQLVLHAQEYDRQTRRSRRARSV